MKRNPLSKLTIPANSFLLDNNKFIGFVEGKMLNNNSVPSKNDFEALLSSVDIISSDLILLREDETVLNQRINEIDSSINEVRDSLASFEDEMESISSDLTEKFSSYGGIISGDVVVDGKISKHRHTYREQIILLPLHENDLITDSLNLYSIYVFIEGITSILDIFDEDSSPTFYIRYSDADGSELVEKTVSRYFGEDAFGNKYLVLENLTPNIQRMLIECDLEDHRISIVAIDANNERKIVSNSNIDSFETVFSEHDEYLDLATTKDLASTSSYISAALDEKINKNVAFNRMADNSFVNGSITIAPDKTIVQQYNDFPPQKYITAKDLAEYDPFSTRKTLIDSLQTIQNTASDSLLSVVIDRLNDIVTLLKNN